MPIRADREVKRGAMRIAGLDLPVHTFNTVVVGTGAPCAAAMLAQKTHIINSIGL